MWIYQISNYKSLINKINRICVRETLCGSKLIHKEHWTLHLFSPHNYPDAQRICDTPWTAVVSDGFSGGMTWRGDKYRKLNWFTCRGFAVCLNDKLACFALDVVFSYNVIMIQLNFCCLRRSKRSFNCQDESQWVSTVRKLLYHHTGVLARVYVHFFAVSVVCTKQVSWAPVHAGVYVV